MNDYVLIERPTLVGLYGLAVKAVRGGCAATAEEERALLEGKGALIVPRHGEDRDHLVASSRPAAAAPVCEQLSFDFGPDHEAREASLRAQRAAVQPTEGVVTVPSELTEPAYEQLQFAFDDSGDGETDISFAA